MMELAMMLGADGDLAFSPFIVPVAGCAMIVGIVAVTSWSSARKRQIESEERLAAIARGVPVPPTMEEIALTRNEPTPNALRRRGSVRMGGIVLVSSAVGVMLFFALLAMILGQREVYSGVACGLIPLGIGVGLLIDARIQTKEIEERGLGAGSQPTSLMRE
jgi:hypothetical protein